MFSARSIPLHLEDWVAPNSVIAIPSSLSGKLMARPERGVHVRRLLGSLTRHSAQPPVVRIFGPIELLGKKYGREEAGCTSAMH